ncbi:MAG: hypothetical protein OXC06_04155 [Acidimicrobiaceae bacterium]|nr:hypothetical protein [Acidimicrobiaceae bacterium]
MFDLVGEDGPAVLGHLDTGVAYADQTGTPDGLGLGDVVARFVRFALGPGVGRLRRGGVQRWQQLGLAGGGSEPSGIAVCRV